jgi:pilus assembly protein CpaE
MPALPTHAAKLTWKPLVVCPQAAMAQRILAVLRELSMEAITTVTEYPGLGQIAPMAQQAGCDVCFLDTLSNAEHAQQLIAELAPKIPVVALHTRADADLILRCLRRGACEFLTDPAPEVLRSLFSRLERARHPAAELASGSFYVVVPGKGGSGASTVAAHLAISLGAGGAKVLLVDGDSLCGSISFLLKLKSEFHLGDVLRDWRRMDDDLWKQLTVRSCGIDVLAAPASPLTRIDVDPQAAAELCTFWREHYEVVILDLAEARAACETGFAALADSVLLVSANELASLQATRRASEYLEKSMGGRTRLRLVLNRYNPATGLKREDVVRALGLEPYAILADDWATMQTALLDGRPAPASSRFAGSVETLCRQLRHQHAPAPEVAEKKTGSWLVLRRRPKAESVK